MLPVEYGPRSQKPSPQKTMQAVHKGIEAQRQETLAARDSWEKAADRVSQAADPQEKKKLEAGAEKLEFAYLGERAELYRAVEHGFGEAAVVIEGEWDQERPSVPDGGPGDSSDKTMNMADVERLRGGWLNENPTALNLAADIVARDNEIMEEVLPKAYTWANRDEAGSFPDLDVAHELSENHPADAPAFEDGEVSRNDLNAFIWDHRAREARDAMWEDAASPADGTITATAARVIADRWADETPSLQTMDRGAFASLAGRLAKDEPESAYAKAAMIMANIDDRTFARIDTASKGGEQDGKISLNDLKAYLQANR